MDQQICDGLQAQLPSALFDAHAHLWRTADLGQPGHGTVGGRAGWGRRSRLAG